MDRKKFIKNTLGAFTAFTVIPRHVPGGIGYTASGEQLNINVTGVGIAGRGLTDPPVYGRLFNGTDLDGWEPVGLNPDSWGVENGLLYTDGAGSGWLSTVAQYDDFIFELEFRVPDGGNSGVFIRAPREGNPAFAGLEIQILDDYAERYSDLKPYQYSGSIYNVKAPSKRVTKPAGEWQSMVIRADGPHIQVTINGEMILSTSLSNHMELVEDHPGLVRRKGYIGLQNHSSRVEFRNIFIHEID